MLFAKELQHHVLILGTVKLPIKDPLYAHSRGRSVGGGGGGGGGGV